MPGPLTHEQKQRLASELRAAPEVVAAWLFGSQASGLAGPLSDIDLGLLLRPGDRGRGVHGAASAWSVRLQDLLDRSDIDVVLLDEAPPLLRFRAIEGELLASNDRSACVAFVTRAVWEHADMEPFRRVQDEALIARLRGHHG